MSTSVYSTYKVDRVRNGIRRLATHDIRSPERPVGRIRIGIRYARSAVGEDKARKLPVDPVGRFADRDTLACRA